MGKVDFISPLKVKYPYMSDEELCMVVNRAKSIYYNKVYACDLSIDETSKPIPKRYNYWIIACCDELIERNGISSATAYSENGFSVTYDSAQVSDKLLSELPNFVGVVR